MAKDIFILEGARTAMAEYSGTPGFGLLKDVSAIDLGVEATKAALSKAGVEPGQVDHIIMGNALQTSPDAIYGARHVGLKAGLPKETPALTVNRICGSGLQSIVSGAQLILLEEAKTVVAGGMENMSQAPHVVRGARTGIKFHQKIEFEDLLRVSLHDPFAGCTMAGTAENVAREHGITRQAQDEYALRSHQLGAEAVKNGTFEKEIVPITVRKGRKEVEVKTDDHVKPETSLEALSKLRTAFGDEGTVTAGNASGIVDGAAAVVASTDLPTGREPIGKIVSWGIVGVEPSQMGIGPAPAIRQALDRAGVALQDVDLFEINEAFAGQYLGVEKDLGLDRDKVNVNGGAIALGHPLGATGTRLALTLLYELKRRGGRYGIASACIGGGQGIAVLFSA